MAERLLLLIHGLGGSAKATWGNFTELVQGDADLSGMQVDHFTYPTFILRLPFGRKYPGIHTLADALATQIENKYPPDVEIFLVCHSLGGLIGKQYIVNLLSAQKHPLRVRSLLLYAVPNNGAAAASVAKLISWRHPQLRHLCTDSDAIRSLSQAWQQTKAEEAVQVKYIVGGQDAVVSEHSARESWSNAKVEVLIDRGHIDIVKPTNRGDLAYLICRKCLIESSLVTLAKSEEDGKPQLDDEQTPPPKQPRHEEIRVVASAILRIDLNGQFLLIRNLHRPESFAPLGGVIKYLPTATERLDAVSFRPQAIDSDMQCDLRGYIPVESLKDFRAWLDSGADRETPEECLKRELREELQEAGLTADLVSDSLRFRHVRTVHEGPEYILSLGHQQYRVFSVFEFAPECHEAKALIEVLEAKSKASQDLLWVDGESAKVGRARTGQVIAAHVPYLFGKARYREPDPIFSQRPPSAA